MIKKGITSLALALVGIAIFTLCIVTAMQASGARYMPFGVTGPSPVIDAIQVKEPDALDLINYASEADLIQAAERGDLYGGYIPVASDTVVTVLAKNFFRRDLMRRGGFQDPQRRTAARLTTTDGCSASHVGPHRRRRGLLHAAHPDRRLPDCHVALCIYTECCR